MSVRLLSVALTTLLLLGASSAAAQGAERDIDVSFEDATLPELVQFVARHTGRRFILTNQMRDIRVSIISERPVSVDELWDGFLAVLDQNGLTAVHAGAYYRIVDTDGIEGRDTPVVDDAQSARSEAFELRMIRVRDGGVEEAAELLRNFSSEGGSITAYAPTRTLLVSDTAANITRMQRILDHLRPARAEGDVRVRRLRYADAEEIAATLDRLAPVRD